MLTKYCNICGKLPAETATKRLVRDHSHSTGFIRGMLCDLCNAYVGIFESIKLKHKSKKRKPYRNWLYTYLNRVRYHLTCNTGVLYCKIK
jgi:CRISPR/Cas system-associated protein Cas10 (large subunit of type III CRISPR-Cas system)